DDGHAVRHQGLRRRHPRRYRQCLGSGVGRPHLRGRGGVRDGLPRVDLYADRKLLARHRISDGDAERSVWPCRGPQGMSATRVVVAGLALALGAFIWRADNYQLYLLALVGLTAVVGVGLNVLLGLSGQISLGHVAFYALGAYVVGILTTKTSIVFWLAWPLGAAAAGAAGAPPAVPPPRRRGPPPSPVANALRLVLPQGRGGVWGGNSGGW